MTALAPVLQAFFTDRLMTHGPPPRTRSRPTATPCGCSSATSTTRPASSPPSSTWPTWTPLPSGAFLAHLETGRGNSAATRNNRLAAIHSLVRYAALKAPDQMDTISRVLAIQAKRTATTIVSYLAPSRARRGPRRARPVHLARPPQTTRSSS